VSTSRLIEFNEVFSLNIFPNPYSTQAAIKYFLPSPARVKIALLDMLGREVATLKDNQDIAGSHTTPLDASLLHTRPGMYIVVFMMDDKIITRKVVQLDSIFN